jgi:hypothetical protein
MNLGGILDRAVQVFRARSIVFIELGFINGLAQLAYRVASVHPIRVTDGDSSRMGLVFLSYAASFVAWLATIFLGAVVPAAVCFAASKVYLGEEVIFEQAFSAFSPKFWRLFWLGFLQAIYAGWPMIIVAVVAIFFSAEAFSSRSKLFATAAIYILGGIPCLILYTQFALAYPATAIEGLTATSAIARSENLSEGGRWRIFWGIVVPSVPSLGLVFGVSGLLNALKHGNALLAGNPLLVAGINGVVSLIVTLLFTPYSSIVLTLLYYDQRIRREGFDVERMMHAAGLDPDATPSAGDPASPSNAIPEGQA